MPGHLFDIMFMLFKLQRVANTMIRIQKRNQTEARLRQKGVRLTPQRIMIFSAMLHGDGHLGVNEIFQRTRKAYPYIDIATVYRTLHLFNKVGLVTSVGIGDKLHFEVTDPDHKHQHMVCSNCGNAFDLGIKYLEQLRNTLNVVFGFQPDLDNFTIRGKCSNCDGSA